VEWIHAGSRFGEEAESVVVSSLAVLVTLASAAVVDSVMMFSLD